MKLFSTIFICNIITYSAQNRTCGKDNSPINVTYEGVTKIETYPWLGYLFYPQGKEKYTTTVVLVTKQVVMGTAMEIDKLPKDDFRAKARVVLGRGCSGLSLPVIEYAYHPDYSQGKQSSIALIQLDLGHNLISINIRPICPPPSYILEPQFYAMTLSEDCNQPRLRLYEMEYVDPGQCKTYYRKSGLDFSHIWPAHTTCAKARQGGECRWQSGTVLALKQDGRWRLMGFGVYGPGCEAPARFMDYGMYHQWVRRSILRTGRPTITRIGRNEVILRRSLSNLQRFGPCDPEETHHELYSDRTTIEAETGKIRRVTYNMTIYASVEYSCVVFRAYNYRHNFSQPTVKLRRWCAGRTAFCLDQQYLEVDFGVEIVFKGRMTYHLKAYGHTVRTMDPQRIMLHMNSQSGATILPEYLTIRDYLNAQRYYGVRYDWMKFTGYGFTEHFTSADRDWKHFVRRTYEIVEFCRNNWNLDCFHNEVHLSLNAFHYNQ